MLEVLEPGLLTTVQGGGRPEAVDLGVPVGGACDPWSLGIANALLGNEPTAAALEMTLAGPSLRAVEECVVAIAGADFGTTVQPSARTVAAASRVHLHRGEVLACGTVDGSTGVRAYLALPGGIDVALVLGSQSTCLVGGFGGINGRPLQAGDRLRAAQPARRLDDLAVPADNVAAVRQGTLRIVRGPHADALGGDAWNQLTGAQYSASARGDRQGVRLDGPPLPLPSDGETFLSHGVCWGAIQLPPDGQPIVLLADHQTVGGYPVPAVVISADRPALGQLGAGDPVRFVEVSIEEAQRVARVARDELRRVSARLAAA